MKKILIFLPFLAFCFTSCNNSSDTMYSEGDSEYVEMVSRVGSIFSDEMYKYPIIPGTDAWYELKGIDDMQLACMIPASWASTASTQSIILSIITNPVISQTHYYDYQLLQFNRFLTQGACMAADRVLQTRDDFADAWLAVYKKMSWETNTDVYSFVYDLASMRHLLLNLSLADQKRMAKAIVEKQDGGKKCNPTVALGNLMLCAQYAPFLSFLTDHPEYVDVFKLGFGRIPTEEEVFGFAKGFVSE